VFDDPICVNRSPSPILNSDTHMFRFRVACPLHGDQYLSSQIHLNIIGGKKKDAPQNSRTYLRVITIEVVQSNPATVGCSGSLQAGLTNN